jgi:4-amino-4-deoxy-L-arabinose transferase-like glycosyltransferase
MDRRGTSGTIQSVAPNSLHTALIVAALFLAAFLPRVFDLGAFATADEKQWVTNTRAFLDALAHGELGNLMQEHHPGIPTQWLGAVTVLSDSPALQKLPLALGQGLLLLAAGYVFFRLWGGTAGILVTLLLALNPPLIAHTRVNAMDSLLAIFVLLSLGLFFLWRKSGADRYLSASGVAGALAILSKLPAVLLLPLLAAVTALWAMRERTMRTYARAAGLWLASAAVTIVIFFPTVVVNPTRVLEIELSFFGSSHYQAEHQAGPSYYVTTMLLFSTPLHVAALAMLFFVFSSRKLFPTFPRSNVAVLVIFVIIFVGAMTVGEKKGDRYILPVFVVFDALAAITFAHMSTVARPRLLSDVARGIFIVGLAWQALLLWRLHPYALAYVNPLTRSLAEGRRLGWGEGLDLAASYLNAKPGAESRIVASYYPKEFGRYFRGRVVPLNHFREGPVDYVVLYRAMLERGEGSWEADMFKEFQDRTPEHIIFLNELPYAWIYAVSDHRP